MQLENKIFHCKILIIAGNSLPELLNRRYVLEDSQGIPSMMPVLLGLILSASQTVDGSLCSTVPGVDRLLDRSAVRWIIAGEEHGTAEMPSAFGDLVCAASKGSRKVIVALEHPVSEQPQIDEYLTSNGDESARSRLLSASIWHWKVADGRTSEAYFSLFERLRVMKKSGQIAGVVTFQPSGRPLAPSDYEKEMARAVEEASTSSDDLVVALVGNVHARTTKYTTRSGESYMPMAGLLPHERTVTLDMSGNGGTVWGCLLPGSADPKAKMSCGLYSVRAPDKIYPRGIALISDTTAPYSAYFNLGTSLSASPPVAVSQGQ